MDMKLSDKTIDLLENFFFNQPVYSGQEGHQTSYYFCDEEHSAEADVDESLRKTLAFMTCLSS